MRLLMPKKNINQFGNETLTFNIVDEDEDDKSSVRKFTVARD